MAMGNSYSESGRPKLAARFFAKALALKPERMAARFNLVNAFFDQNKFDLAPVEYMQVAARNENALASKANEMIMITRQEMLAQ